MSNFIELAVNKKVSEVTSKLTELDIDDNELINIVKAPEINLCTALRKFSLMKNLDNFILSKKSCVSAEEKVLGKTESGKIDSFQYVPILKTLDIICSKEDVLGHIMCPPENNSKILSFRYGNIFKNNELFCKRKEAIQIILFSDEFVPVNKIGNKTRKHKVTAFYFVLGNIPCKL